MSVDDPHEAERELRDEPDPDAWAPEPAALREGETRDDQAHAAANREMVRRAKIEGVEIEEGDDGE